MHRTTRKKLLAAICAYEAREGGHSYVRDSASIQGAEEWVCRGVVLGFRLPPSGFAPDPTYWASKILSEHRKNPLPRTGPQLA